MLKVFWSYINRSDLFPSGWLHDIGLPMAEAVEAIVDKGEAKGRRITIQAFQRTVLTYDPLNPTERQVGGVITVLLASTDDTTPGVIL